MTSTHDNELLAAGISRGAPRGRGSIGHLGGLAGMAAPVLFLVGLVATTWAEWDYLRGLGFSLTDHGDTAWPSGLAQGPVGWAQVVNYAVYGVLLLVFFRGLASELPRRRSRRVASTLLGVSAVGWIFVAFPEDGPPFGDPTTWAGFAHAIGFTILVLFGTTGMVSAAVALRDDARWRGYALVSAVAAAAVFFFLVVLVFALEVATTLGIYGFFAVHMLWVEVLALRLRRVAG